MSGEKNELEEKELKGLDEEAIVSERKVGRRSALAVIGGAVAGAVAMTGMTPSEASAQSDSDSGRNADPAGRGRTGLTDSDSGGNADRAGHGRRRRRRRRCSDSDGGRYSDPAGRGRRC